MRLYIDSVSNNGVQEQLRLRFYVKALLPPLSSAIASDTQVEILANEKQMYYRVHMHTFYFVQVPQEVLVPEPVVAVAAGNYHTVALAESGNVWTWGRNDAGQLGIGQDVPGALEPRLVKPLQGGPAEMDRRPHASLADLADQLTSAAPLLIAAWRRSHAKPSSQVPLTFVACAVAGEKVVQVAAGSEHCLALTGSGEVFSWGSNQHGRLGHGKAPGQGFMRPASPGFTPRQIRALETKRIKQVGGRVQYGRGCCLCCCREHSSGWAPSYESGLTYCHPIGAAQPAGFCGTFSLGLPDIATP